MTDGAALLRSLVILILPVLSLQPTSEAYTSSVRQGDKRVTVCWTVVSQLYVQRGTENTVADTMNAGFAHL